MAKKIHAQESCIFCDDDCDDCDCGCHTRDKAKRQKEVAWDDSPTDS